MESTLQSLTPESALCEEKASQVMQWISGSEDISKYKFAIVRLFEPGVLPENTKAFLHALLELQFPGDRVGLELPPEQLHALLRDAFTKTYFYLLTPQAFLTDFLSFGADAITINGEMLTRLTYLTDYPYFPDMIDEWLDIESQMGHVEIPKTEFEEFLSRTDRTVISHSSLEKITQYHKPLFEFHSGAVETRLPASLSRDLVHSLLADKGLALPMRLVKDEYSLEDTAYALKEALLLAEAAEPAEELPVPEYGAFLKELRDIGIILPTPHNKIAHEDNLLPPMQMFISEKLRARCLEKIFHNNTKEYERAIGVLNATSEYAQAELNLRTLLDMYKIPEDAKVARRLHKALRLRFNIPSPVVAE